VLGRKTAREKTTTLLSILGLNAPRPARSDTRAGEIVGLAPYKSPNGDRLCPGRPAHIPDLTVYANLDVAEKGLSGRKSKWTFDRIYKLFRFLRISVTTGRRSVRRAAPDADHLPATLMGDPDLLLLD